MTNTPHEIKQKGFTIIELLIAVSVGAIASLLIVTSFVYTYGSVVIEQVTADMVQDSQLFLRRMTEDIRLSNSIRATNQIADSYKGAGWVTSDPANILIITQPATDSNNDLIYDDATGFPYQHEIIYFGDSTDNVMYRRLLIDVNATGTVQRTTCPAGTSGCPADVELVDNLENLLFEFYDSDDAVVADAGEARSVEVTVNLKRSLYGKDVTTSNTTRITLRNE